MKGGGLSHLFPQLCKDGIGHVTPTWVVLVMLLATEVNTQEIYWQLASRFMLSAGNVTCCLT